MYLATTRHINVEVTPFFLEDQSEPQDNHYVWAYRVNIENDSTQTVQLKTRYWRITNGTGHSEEVRGEGVVGEQPVLEPGDNYQYTSGCPLSTPSGIMVGSYTMESEFGESFEIAIPAFSLDSPYEEINLN